MDDTAAVPSLNDRLAKPRKFALPMLLLVNVLLLNSLPGVRPRDRWAALCFQCCALFVAFRSLPEQFPTDHPAGAAGGVCYADVADILDYETTVRRG